MLDAIIKQESNDITIVYTLYIWNGKNFVKKDSTFIYWCDVYDNDNEKIVIRDLTIKNNVSNWQII